MNGLSYAILSLIGVLFISVIGVYWRMNKLTNKTNEELGKIYDTVNKHKLNAAIHTHKKEFVNGEVCEERHRQITKSLGTIETDVKCLLGKVNRK